MKKQQRLGLASLNLLLVSTANAVSLDPPSSGPFARIGAFFQELVDFLGGTGTMFVVFCSLAVGIGLWVSIPKQGGAALGFVFRACIGAICLFGLGTLITWIKSF